MNYKLTVEDGVITRVETTDAKGAPVRGLSIPKEATAFSADAWGALGTDAQ